MADLTIAEHIEAALFQVEEERGSSREPFARDLAVAVTKLEEARMWATRGLARKQGWFAQADLQKS